MGPPLLGPVGGWQLGGGLSDNRWAGHHWRARPLWCMWPQFGGNLAWSQLSSTAIACRNISSLSANSIQGSCSDSGSLILGTRLRFFHNGMCSIFAMAIVAGDVATAQRRRQGRMVITRARPCPPAFSLPSCDESITDQAVFLVFSSPLLSRQLARRGQRRERRPALFPDSPRWRPNCHPTTRCRRPEGEDRQCPPDEHEGGWCWRLQQHHAEYVLQWGTRGIQKPLRTGWRWNTDRIL